MNKNIFSEVLSNYQVSWYKCKILVQHNNMSILDGRNTAETDFSFYAFYIISILPNILLYRTINITAVIHFTNS